MTLERVPLDQVGRLRGGYVARERPERVTGVDGLYAVTRSGVGGVGRRRWAELDRIRAFPEASAYLVEEGDVLLPLRGAGGGAIVAEGLAGPTVAVGHWAVLTPDSELALPGFLAWYLNLPVTARRLAAITRGSNLPFLSLRQLRTFEVELPPLETQRRIARVQELDRRVSALERKLKLVRARWTDAVTLGALRAALADRGGN